MRDTSIWKRVLGLDKTVINATRWDDNLDAMIVSVRPNARACSRCGICNRRCSRYDRGHGVRLWRTVDVGLAHTYLEAEAPRVTCRFHGVVVAAVPWARHGAGHTRVFDDTVAWLATHTSKSATGELTRIAWRTVGAIVDRVWADSEHATDRFAGLTRIGIDEISYKRGHKYLTVVVDHSTGRLVWAAAGRDKATLEKFFTLLGEQRSAQLTHITADAASWIAHVVAARAPQAVRCADPFHIVAWATKSLDKVRRSAWNRARRTEPSRQASQWHARTKPDRSSPSHQVKNVRWALLKNPENLTARQKTQLEWVALHDPLVHRAYLLKEELRLIFALDHTAAEPELDAWLGRAAGSGITEFVALAGSVAAQRAPILAAIEHGLSNGRIESVNTKIRLITRQAFGFATPESLIALAMLSLGGDPPRLPTLVDPRMRQ
ncbi:ISL3 family transposase [Rhodococcus sp. NPDC058505]|uniref:ISL3 family transposase n=1 Tax=Rhodococcus sp. NPDC058505 TaxID=3346531 RepID=UPI003654C69B